MLKPWCGQPRLTVRGFNHTRLIDSLARHVDLVTRAVGDVAADVPVHGALCFVDANAPVVFPLELRSFAIVEPWTLARRINARGPVTPEILRAIAAELARRLPPA